MKLFIDSATSYLYLAIISSNKKDVYLRFGKNDHSETLVDNLSLFLERNNVKISDIEKVFIGRGPGSYTGIRITGTVGKVLSYATKKELKSFSSLDLLLASKMNQDGKYIARIIAKKNYSYVKVIEVKKQKITTIVDDCFVPDEELSKYQDCFMIMPTEDILNQCLLAETLDNLKLYRSESNYDYVPNYLRSELS